MDFHRNSRSIGRRSSILKIDRDDDTTCNVVFNNRGSKSSRRVSFAETYQVKEFPRDSPQHHVVWKQETTEDEAPVPSENVPLPNKVNNEIKGLDKLLTGPIQTDPYQSIVDGGMPDLDMSNLFSGERTILGPLDMDTTAALGNIEIPGMTFNTEPSAEIKIDGSALLRSMMGKPSDRLKTMQIYSPNREPLRFTTDNIENMDTSFTLRSNERSPMKTLLAQDDDGDNFVMDTEPPPIKSFHLFDDPPVESQSLLNTNSNNLYGKKPVFGENGEMKFMNDDENESPFVYQGPGSATSMQFDNYTVSPSQEITRYFDTLNQKMGLEETACIGGIMQEPENVNLARQINNSLSTGDTTGIQINTDSGNGMDETECIGCIMNDGSQGLQSSRQVLSSTNMDTTKQVDKMADTTNPISVSRLNRRSFGENGVEMEETKCIGGIVDKSLQATNRISGLFTRDTVTQPIADMTMEETKCIGGVLDKTSNATNLKSPCKLGNETQSIGDICVEQTKCIGGILDKTSNIANLNSPLLNDNEIQAIEDVGLEETKCVGGILDKTSSTVNLKSTFINNNVTQTTEDNGIEETKCIGGILDKTSNTSDLKSEIKDRSDLTGMEETKCVGGILDKTVEIANRRSNSMNISYTSPKDTLSIEQSNCVGDLHNETSSQKLELRKLSHVPSNEITSMEETKYIGGILDKSLKATCQQPDISTANNTKVGEAIYAGSILEKLGFKTKRSVPLSNEISRMEDTTCIVGITDKSVNAAKQSTGFSNTGNTDVGEAKFAGNFLEKLGFKTNKTVQSPDDTTGMEETKCIGGIIDKTVDTTSKISEFRNSCNVESSMDTVGMDETKCRGGILEKSKLLQRISPNIDTDLQLNKTIGMDETKCRGGILEKSNLFQVISPKINTNVQLNKTIGMDETKFIGRINIDDTNSLSPLNQMKHKEVSNLDDSQRMAETQRVGEIVNIDKTAVKSLNQTDKSLNNSIMEKTKCFDLTGTWTASDSNRVLNRQGSSSENIDTDNTTDITGSLGDKSQLYNRSFGDVGIDGTENSGPDKSSVTMMEETKCTDTVLGLRKASDLSMQMNEHESIGQTIERHMGSSMTMKNILEANKTVNKTAMLEETTCLGGIIKDDTTTNATRHDVMAMNVTDCLGGILSKGPQNKLDVSGCELIEDSDELKRGVDHTKLMSVDMEETQCSQGRLSPATKPLGPDLNYKHVDEEVTFVTKKSSKRTHEIDNVDIREEKTKDFTISQSKYQRLKDQLILSKGKSAVHLKTADSQTLSKSQSNVSKDLGLSFQDMCPASKKMKLSESPIKSEEIDQQAPGRVETVGERISSSDQDVENVNLSFQDALSHSGINDEQMPEEMHTGLLSNTGLTNVTQNSNASGHHDSSDVANITRSTNSAENNQSMSLCHSKLLQSFVIPSGPMTMESFMKAMYLSKIKTANTRCSLLFLPKIDLEDRMEVMLAELTLGASVDAKKQLCHLVSERIKKEQETVEWLHATLEEIQPQIFQDCASLEGTEFEKLQERMFDLLAACSKQARTEWLNLTTTHVESTLQAVKTNGKARAEDILTDVRSKSQKVDEFMASLDDDMSEMEKDEILLVELDKKEGSLASDLEQLELDVERREREEERLAVALQQRRDGETIRASVDDLKEKIKVHLMCVAWDLDEQSESHAVFTFLDKLLVLTVNFCPNGHDIQITDTTVRSLLNTDRCPQYRRFAHSLAVAGIESILSLKRYTTLADLKHLLTEVSTTIHEVTQLCEDLKPVKCRKKFHFEQNRLSMDFWSLKTLDEISVTLAFNPCTPLSAPADIHVHVLMGKIRGDDVTSHLDGVEPGERYMSRLLDVARLDQT